MKYLNLEDKLNGCFRAKVNQHLSICKLESRSSTDDKSLTDSDYLVSTASGAWVITVEAEHDYDTPFIEALWNAVMSQREQDEARVNLACPTMNDLDIYFQIGAVLPYEIYLANRKTATNMTE